MKRTPTLIAIIVLGLALLGAALAYGRYGMGMQGRGAGVQAGAVLAGAGHDDVAALLGITGDELTALHQEGKTLGEIAADLGVDLPTFRGQLIALRNETIDEAVAAGTLTEEQATWIRTRTETMVQAMLDRQVGPRAGFAYGPNAGAAGNARSFGMQAHRATGPGSGPGFGPGFGPGAGPNAAPQRSCPGFGSGPRNDMPHDHHQGPAWNR